MHYDDKNFRIAIRNTHKAAEEILKSTFYDEKLKCVTEDLKNILVKLEKDVSLSLGVSAQLALEKRKLESFKTKQRYNKTKNMRLRNAAASSIAIALKTIATEVSLASKITQDVDQSLLADNFKCIRQALKDVAENLHTLAHLGDADDVDVDVE